MSKEDTLSGKGRSQQLGRMGEYAVMAELLAKPWVANVYAPAVDTGVDLVLLTNKGRMKKIQVKTSRVYKSGGYWFSVSRRHVKEDSSDEDMFYVFAEDRPPKNFLIFPSEKILELFENGFSGICHDRLIQFMEFGSKLQVRHSGLDRRKKLLAQAKQAGKTVDKYWNNWDLLK